MRGRENAEEALHAMSGYLDELEVKLQGKKKKVSCAFFMSYALTINDIPERECNVLRCYQ
jgi:hypothetical protein